jgi:hypothetical protein
MSWEIPQKAMEPLKANIDDERILCSFLSSMISSMTVPRQAKTSPFNTIPLCMHETAKGGKQIESFNLIKRKTFVSNFSLSPVPLMLNMQIKL